MDDFELGVTPTQTGLRRSVRAPRGPRLRRPPRALTVGLSAACVLLVTTGLALAPVPNLPQADAYEVTLARQIAATLPPRTSAP